MTLRGEPESRAAGDGIDHGDEFNVVAGGEFLGVEAAQASGADHGYAEFVHVR